MKVAKCGLAMAFCLLASCGANKSDYVEQVENIDTGNEELLAELEIYRSGIDAIKSAAEEAQTAAQIAQAETTRFDSEDWADVVGDVRTSAENADNAALETLSAIEQLETELP